jgi:hypothetical protein
MGEGREASITGVTADPCFRVGRMAPADQVRRLASGSQAERVTVREALLMQPAKGRTRHWASRCAVAIVVLLLASLVPQATVSASTNRTSIASIMALPAASLTLTASSEVVDKGQAIILTAQFVSYGANRSIVLQKRTALDSDWVAVAVLITDSLGRATVSIAPSATTSYRASFLGASDLMTGTSNIVQVVVRDALRFLAQPTAATAGEAFPAQPVVSIQNANGDIVAAPDTTVTLAIAANPGGGTLTCDGGNTRATVSGVATFGGCTIDRAGVGYTLSATASGLTSAIGAPFDVTAPAVSMSIAASAAIANQLQAVALSVQFASSGASRLVILERKTALDSGWVAFASAPTDLTGKATAQITVTNTASYRASFAGAADLSAGVSNTVSISVRYIAKLTPTTPTGWSTVARGTSRTYVATVRPLYLGQRVSFLIYGWDQGAWVFQTSATKTADSSGKATFTWKWTQPGKWYIRARANSTPLNTTAFSNVEKVVVP